MIGCCVVLIYMLLYVILYIAISAQSQVSITSTVADIAGIRAWGPAPAALCTADSLCATRATKATVRVKA